MKNKKSSTRGKVHYITVTSKSYGSILRGKKIYYEGKKPKNLSDDGRIKFGKHILEFLNNEFGDNYKWIITPKENSIKKQGTKYIVRTSLILLTHMNKEYWNRTRDIKHDIVRNFFSSYFPKNFQHTKTGIYVAGTLSNILRSNPLSKLSTDDKDALNAFLPSYITSESIKTVNLLKAETQIKSLKELAATIKKEINKPHSESWWQNFTKSNILIIQQGYINSLEKMNIAIGNTKFPDFSLITHDNYIDILEIKTPTTNLLRYDTGRDNFFWDTEISKAISQVENYIANITRHSDSVRTFILDKKKINLQVLRPRGIILAGNSEKFSSQKEKDDFRLLSQSLKNITILTYDELKIRLENYIQVLRQYKNK